MPNTTAQQDHADAVNESACTDGGTQKGTLQTRLPPRHAAETEQPETQCHVGSRCQRPPTRERFLPGGTASQRHRQQQQQAFRLRTELLLRQAGGSLTFIRYRDSIMLAMWTTIAAVPCLLESNILRAQDKCVQREGEGGGRSVGWRVSSHTRRAGGSGVRRRTRSRRRNTVQHAQAPRVSTPNAPTRPKGRKSRGSPSPPGGSSLIKQKGRGLVTYHIFHERRGNSQYLFTASELNAMKPSSSWRVPPALLI